MVLKKRSILRSFRVPETGFRYSGIRVFYKAHPHLHEFPEDSPPLPMVVFIHGLGGSAAQFAPLLNSMIHVASCLCIDLPGCGRSHFAPKAWEAYTPYALAHLVATIINSYRDKWSKQGIVFVGHSTGCSIAAALASGTPSEFKDFAQHTVGFIALCPRISNLDGEQAKKFKRLLKLPTPLFGLLNWFDRIGEEDSESVTRVVGEGADIRTRRMQMKLNMQSRSAVWRRMAWGLLPRADGDDKTGLAGEVIWQRIKAPFLLIAGECDTMNRPDEIHRIAQYLSSSRVDINKDSFIIVNGEKMSNNDSVIKTIVLPAPASHALPYEPNTCRVVSGLIQNFVAEHVDGRLALGWQLQYFSNEGKWDVKNLDKWRRVSRVSEPVGPLLRAMKTMRENDEYHSPKAFADRFATKIKAVIDISMDAPVYDPKILESHGIEYHKSPTVSKQVPSEDDVQNFNALVDRLRASLIDGPDGTKEGTIAVHCHYGFNRTGFFIVCYLVEREGWTLREAIKEFARQRRPGIKHDYFVDTLYVRYNAKGRKEEVI